jgi:NitT/TauT family transport system substrate-binding protein
MKNNSAHSRRTVLTAAAAIAATGTWPRAYAQSTTPTKVKVGYTINNEFAGLFVGIDRGIFAKRGLDVEPILLANNSLIPTVLASGSIDIGTPGINIMLVAASGGISMKLICGAAVLSAARPTAGIVARTGSDIQKATDFAGKRLAVPGFNAGFHVTAREWLLKGGQDLKSVNFVEASFAQMPDLLRGSKVDAVVAGEPTRSRIISANIGYAVDNMLTAIRDPAISGVYATSSTYVERNPRIVQAFREGIAEALALIKSTPRDDVLASLSTYLKQPVEVLKQAPMAILEADIQSEGVAYWIDVMTRQGLLKSPLSPQALFI